MNTDELKAKEPIIFVTGIGQTWSSVKVDGKVKSWNLVPTDKEIMLGDFKLKDYLSLASMGLRAAVSLVTGANALKNKHCIGVMQKLFKYCVADDKGKISDEVFVRIYGAQSFDKLKKIDYETGLPTDNEEKSLVDRIYRDIPCKRFINSFGEENVYCFNYSSFSYLYSDADALHEMIKAVIADQKDKTGAKKVVLIPMSMGATVVNAYLDKYCPEDLPKEENPVSKVIGIVGAWNGSDALADLLVFNTAEDFSDRLCNECGEKAGKIIKKFKPQRLNKVAATLVDSLVEALMLRTTTFMALIPCERYEQIQKVLFTPERMKRNPNLVNIQKEAERYHNAQVNMRQHFEALNKKLGIDFYFISGYGLKFGMVNRDFGFLSMFHCAEKSNTDAVIQISSTSPGTTSVPVGQQIEKARDEYISPDGSVDASTAYFNKTSWYFEGQQHELGTNNTALRLALGIAAGVVKDVYGEFPRFNFVRHIRNGYELIDKAKQLLSDKCISEEKKNTLGAAMQKAQQMLDSVINNPTDDNRAIDELEALVEGK